MEGFERGDFGEALTNAADQMLAWFAQPGRLMCPPDVKPQLMADAFAATYCNMSPGWREVSDTPRQFSPDDSREVRELKQIVNGMREELREYLANGNGTPRYVRSSQEQLVRVKNWYRRQQGERWFAATMMLEFAMRNGDVLRLRPENFVERRSEVKVKGEGEQRTVSHYLCYVPHKTALSSGRRVCWPVHEDIWRRIDECGGLKSFDITDETFDGINRDLRGLGFSGSKASYELRKICIDHIYQRFGAEKAVSISGDDIRTISRYYADPAQPNIGTVRVLDLIG